MQQKLIKRQNTNMKGSKEEYMGLFGNLNK